MKKNMFKVFHFVIVDGKDFCLEVPIHAVNESHAMEKMALFAKKLAEERSTNIGYALSNDINNMIWIRKHSLSA